MRYEQNAVLASLRRAQQFLDTNADVLTAVNNSTRKQLDEVVTLLSDLSITQDGSTRGSLGETARQRALLLALRRNFMAPVAELAKFKLRDVPEFAALTLPPSGTTAQRLIAAAYAMADAATPHAQVLIDNGLPTTFVDDLRTAAAAVGESIAGRTMYLGRRVGATAGLAAEEKHGRALLRVLNALIMARIGNDAQLIAEWTSAKMVRRKPGPAAGSHTTTVTTNVTTNVTPIVTPTPAPAPVTAVIAVTPVMSMTAPVAAAA